MHHNNSFLSTLASLSLVLVVTVSTIALEKNLYPTPAPIQVQRAAIYDAINDPTPAIVEDRENSPAFHYVNPLLYIETNQKLFPEYDAFDAAISAYIKNAMKNGTIESASVYFRDMNSGHWTGVNNSYQFEPSSMLKVAVMIAAYRTAVRQAALSSYSVDTYLEKQLYYPGPNNSTEYYVSTSTLVQGNYSEKELINDMIINSDNVALNVVLADNKDEFNKVYKDFRFPAALSDGAVDYMTPQSYSVIFRTLFNSTYLPWDVSESLLGLLASTTFNLGIVAGVPAGTTVSHKFGEHTNTGFGKVIDHELHDCGIVYYPNNPYLICIMTKGQSFPILQKTIADISKKAYDYTDQKYGQHRM